MTYQERKIQILEERISNQLYRVAEAKLNHEANLMNFAEGSSPRWITKSGRKLVEAENQLYALEARLERVKGA